MRIFNYTSFIFFSFFYIPMLSKKKFDHIFVYAPSPVIHALLGIVLKKLMGIKMSLWLQDILTSALEVNKKSQPILIWALNIILKYIYKESDIIFAQSQKYNDYFKKIISRKKIVYLPNLINRNFETKKNIDIKNFNPEKFNICYFGNMGIVQEFNTILNAAKIVENKEIYFHFFGEGVEKNNIKKEVYKKNLKNFFIHDYIDYEMLKKTIHKSSILFLSLKKNKKLNFTAPSKLQLYMYCGKPILAEINGESKRIIVDSKCGITVRHNNLKQMINSINYLYKIRKSSKFKGYGKKAKEYFNNNFSEKKIFNTFIKSIDQVI